MHPFSGRVCHQNEGIKTGRGKHGNQRGEAPTQGTGEENHQDDSTGKSWGNSEIAVPREKPVQVGKEKSSAPGRRSLHSDRLSVLCYYVESFGDTVRSFGGL